MSHATLFCYARIFQKKHRADKEKNSSFPAHVLKVQNICVIILQDSKSPDRPATPGGDRVGVCASSALGTGSCPGDENGPAVAVHPSHPAVTYI